jgi:hypothetical protein
VVNEIIANRKYREEQEAKEKAREAEANHTKLVGTIDEGWKRIEKEAKSIGFPVNEEIRQKLLDICVKEQIDPRFMYARFLDEYKTEIDKYQRAKIQSDLTKSREKSHKSGIIPASSTQSKSTIKPDEKQTMLSKVLDKFGLQS